jgi:hypothetical protein
MGFRFLDIFFKDLPKEIVFLKILVVSQKIDPLIILYSAFYICAKLWGYDFAKRNTILGKIHSNSLLNSILWHYNISPREI